MWLWERGYLLVAELLVGPVYLLQADLRAWEYLLRVVRSGLVYPSAVERAMLAYPPGVHRTALAHPSVEQVRWEY